MKYNSPARWYIVCYQRNDSEFETLSRFGVQAVSMADPRFDPTHCPAFHLRRDKVFKLYDDFDWTVTSNFGHRNAELFRQWGNLILIGWRSHVSGVQYLSLDLLRMVSSN